jgi:RNA polymerase sigma-70 factor (ECF subfamily)
MGRGQLGETCTTLDSWAVAEALASLHPDLREVLVETYYRGRSVAEAAATLGIPAGIVKSRAFYALKALRLALMDADSRLTARSG